MSSRDYGVTQKWVYFVYFHNLGLVKIGITGSYRSLVRRLIALGEFTGHAQFLIRLVRGDERDEAAYHYMFRERHVFLLGSSEYFVFKRDMLVAEPDRDAPVGWSAWNLRSPRLTHEDLRRRVPDTCLIPEADVLMREEVDRLFDAAFARLRAWEASSSAPPAPAVKRLRLVDTGRKCGLMVSFPPGVRHWVDGDRESGLLLPGSYEAVRLSLLERARLKVASLEVKIAAGHSVKAVATRRVNELRDVRKTIAALETCTLPPYCFVGGHNGFVGVGDGASADV